MLGAIAIPVRVASEEYNGETQKRVIGLDVNKFGEVVNAFGQVRLSNVDLTEFETGVYLVIEGTASIDTPKSKAGNRYLAVSVNGAVVTQCGSASEAINTAKAAVNG